MGGLGTQGVECSDSWTFSVGKGVSCIWVAEFNDGRSCVNTSADWGDNDLSLWCDELSPSSEVRLPLRLALVDSILSDPSPTENEFMSADSKGVMGSGDLEIPGRSAASTSSSDSRWRGRGSPEIHDTSDADVCVTVVLPEAGEGESPASSTRTSGSNARSGVSERKS